MTYILGLTGGSGSGKGYVAHKFEKFGIYSIDTDLVYREISIPGTQCLDELTRRFGEKILAPDGRLDRRALAPIVFSDGEKLSELNRITHKYILAETRRRIDIERGKGAYAVIIDAPVLFESRFNVYCDYTIGVLCDTETRLNRIIERDGITEEAALQRISSQKPNRFFIDRCDFLIYNGSGNPHIGLQVDILYQQLRFV